MNLAEKAAWIIQLSNNNHDNSNIELAETQLENIKKKKQHNTASQQLGHSQLQLEQLCLQDPASAANRQLPKESLSSACLSDSSLDPAASLTETTSFSKQKLSAQDLTDRSFDKNKQQTIFKMLSLQSNFDDILENKQPSQREQEAQLPQLQLQQKPLEKENQETERDEHLAERNLLQVQLVYYKFFEENFGHRISEKQLQQNLSQDHQQLQDSNLAQTNFQQFA